MFIRTIYKAISFSKVIFLQKLFTAIFKIRLRINAVEYGCFIKTFNAIPGLLINRNCAYVGIGNNVMFNNFTDHSWNSKCKLIVTKGATLFIGDNSGMNGVMIYCSLFIKISNNVKIGGGTRISDSNHHSLDFKNRRDYITDHMDAKAKPVIIEDDVFIGAGCIIGKGVTIGARSIVAAGSVVVKSIPSDEIWGGNPAVLIKKIL